MNDYDDSLIGFIDSSSLNFTLCELKHNYLSIIYSLIFFVISAACSLYNYPIMSYDYSPNRFVRAGHNIPHLSKTLGSESNNFDTINDDWTSYIYSVTVFPAIFVAAGILSLLIYQLVLCFRCCCCRNANLHPQPDQQSIFCWTVTKKNPLIFSCFYIFAVFAMCANLCVLISNYYFSNMIDEGKSSMTTLETIFTDISDYGDSLSSVGSTSQTTMNNATCSVYYSSYTSIVSSFISDATDITDTVGTFPDTIESAKDDFSKYTGYISEVLYIYLGVIGGVILMVFFSNCCKTTVYLNFTIAIAELIVLALTVLAGIEMIIVVSDNICFSCMKSGNIIMF